MQSIKAEEGSYCPTCYSKDAKSIVYGLVTGLNQRDTSKYYYAGCMMEQFQYLCNECGNKWGDIYKTVKERDI